MARIFLIVLCLTLSVSCQADCPAHCQCQAGVLTCQSETGGKLKTVPEKLYTFELSAIIKVNFEGNEIGELHTGDFTGLRNVEVLNLKTNKLKLLLQGFFSGLRELRQLVVADNSIRFLDSLLFNALPNLQDVDLSYNQLEYIPRETFMSSANGHGSPITNLNLMHNDLNILSNGMFEGLSNLESLNLDNNNIEVIEENAFQPLIQLRVLSLKDVDLKSSIFLSVLSLHSLPDLSKIYLSESLFACNCDWLDLKKDFDSVNIQIMDVPSSLKCNNEISHLCEQPEQERGNQNIGRPVIITLRELVPPKFEDGKLIILGQPRKGDTRQLILDYAMNVTKRIRLVPHAHKRNVYLRIFESRMDDFIHKFFPSMNEEWTRIELKDTLNMSMDNKTRYKVLGANEAYELSRIDAHHRKNLQMAEKTKDTTAIVLPVAIVLVLFMIVCCFCGKGGKETGIVSPPGCLQWVNTCMDKLNLRHEYIRRREQKAGERTKFWGMHQNAKKNINQVKDSSKPMPDYPKQLTMADLQKQRRMSLGANNSSSSSESEEDDGIFNRSTVQPNIKKFSQHE